MKLASLIRRKFLKRASDRRADALVIDRSGRHQLIRDTLKVARAPYVRDGACVVLNSTSWKSGSVIDVRFHSRCDQIAAQQPLRVGMPMSGARRRSIPRKVSE